MERKECEEKILELMKQIKKVADEYYEGNTYLSISILEDGFMMAFNEDSYNGGEKPIDVYFNGKKRGELHGKHQG